LTEGEKRAKGDLVCQPNAGQDKGDDMSRGVDGEASGNDGNDALSTGDKGAIKVLDANRYDAMLFDMDGVITRSAVSHGSLWKDVMDEFLERFSARNNIPFRPFDTELDYHNFMDGKPRYDGVCNFLVSRGIALPFGEPSDDEHTDTCCGLGNRKNRRFKDHLETHGVELFDSTVDLIHRFRAGGKRVAVVSASKNCETVLRMAGLFDVFHVMVSGREAAAMSLAGKPAPDTYLKAAELLHTEMGRCVVFEDSVTGIQAGKAAGAGFIVGIDRAADASAFIWYGADVVVTDLSELYLDWRDAPSPSHHAQGARPAARNSDTPDRPR
jgi:alpha,alpha-trehalase